MSPDEVLRAAEELFAKGDYLGADHKLAEVWRDTTHAPPAVLHLLGAIHFKHRDFVGAEQFLRRAVKAAPGNARHHAALGELLAVAGYFSHAADSYAEAMRLDPGLNNIADVRALALYAAQRFSESEKVAREAIAKQPSAWAWDLLSSALREQGKAKDAADAAEQALKLQPGFAGAMHSRAAAYTLLGRDKEALDLFESLTVRGVETPALWFYRAKALVNLRRFNDAAGLFSDGLRRWPGEPRLAAALSEMRQKAH